MIIPAVIQCDLCPKNEKIPTATDTLPFWTKFKLSPSDMLYHDACPDCTSEIGSLGNVLNWKWIFNGALSPAGCGVSRIRAQALQAGYRFYCFNDSVFYIGSKEIDAYVRNIDYVL